MEFRIGTRVFVRDMMNPDTTVEGVIALIEEEPELPNLYWLYIVADEKELNKVHDNRIGYYYTIREHTSDDIEIRA